MTFSIDALLAQVADLRRRVEAGETAEALAAIDGLRMTVMLGAPAIEPTPLPAPGGMVGLSVLAEAAAQASGAGSTDGDPAGALSVRRFAFDAAVDGWGWHPPQTDSRGRAYRWCGGAPEAGIVLRSKAPRALRGFAFRMRFVSDAFVDGTFRVRVNDVAAPFSLTPQEDGHHLLVAGCPQWGRAAPRTVSFQLLTTVVPKEIDLSTDRRRLLFNVYEIAEISGECVAGR